MSITFTDLIGGAIALIATVAIAYASIAQGSDPAMTALVGLAGASAGFFLRAKVQAPTP